MTALPGRWALTMLTPVGSIDAVMTFREEDGVLHGDAAGKQETVPLRIICSAPTADGERVTWTQSITRPMRLNLDFDVLLSGDAMTGHSRAGRLPRSTVTGRRVPWDRAPED